MNMEFVRKLPVPVEIKEKYPQTFAMAEVLDRTRLELRQIFTGESKKLLLVIDDCSADREDSVLEYISRLKELQGQVRDQLLLIPRIYTGKPRTTGDGYKGMLHQPDPSGKPDMLKGIISIRSLHMQAVQRFGMATADEMLYPENHRYLSDLLAYVAVGARSVENQEHRLVASGLNLPVGMKNPTGGDLSVMMNAIAAAQHPHTFIYRGWEVRSKGNPLAHAILRGYVNKHGQSMPNYHYEDLQHLCQLYEQRGLANPAVLIDTNHANSGKQYKEQIRICKEVLHSCRLNPDLHTLVKGFMIESYLEDGCQSPDGGVYGKSITDPCLGWTETERLVLDVAALWDRQQS